MPASPKRISPLVIVVAVFGCKGQDPGPAPAPKARLNEPAAPPSAAVRDEHLEKCEPNHEPALPETITCLADLGDGFTVYEWVVEREGTFVVSARPAPTEALHAPRMEIIDDGGTTIQRAAGASAVELRARFAPGPYSVVVMTDTHAARHLRLAISRDGAAARE
jgi:hypothetical protein